MIVHKPEKHEKAWGEELWIANSEKYCGKILNLKAGYRCSYHYHKIKDETFYVLDGYVDMKVNGKKVQLHRGEAIHIAPGVKHSFQASSKGAKILEISTQHFEDDSYREDKSGKI